MTAPHVVLVTEELPFQKVAGHHQINMALLDALRARGYRITILLTAARMQGPIVVNPYPDVAVVGPCVVTSGRLIIASGLRSFLKLGIKQIVEAGPSLAQNLVLGMRTKLAPAIGGILGKFDTPAQIAWVVHWISVNKPDAVFFDTVFRCPSIPHLAEPKPKTFVLTHDVFHLRHASLKARGLALSPEHFDRAEEAALLAPADVLIAINADEQAILREMVPSAQVVEASMTVKTVPRPVTRMRDPQRLIFVGSDSIHNEDGLRWFLNDVWPKIRTEAPQAHLDVYGLVCRAIPFAPDGVTLHGRVRDLTEAYHTAQIALCPLKAGSGLKIKMLEYFSHGLPCITTSIGAAGFAKSDSPPYVVADTPDEFAHATLRFLRDSTLTDSYEQRAYAYCALYVEPTFTELLEALPRPQPQAAAETTRLRPSRLAR